MATQNKMGRQVKIERGDLSLSRWDSADYLHSEQDRAGYFDAALEAGGDDPVYMLHGLGNIARARGMMKLASESGLMRAGLYQALAPNAKPRIQTVHKIAKALGFKLTFTHAV